MEIKQDSDFGSLRSVCRRRAWSELTTADVNAVADAAVAVLPLGAMEQHGPHLPLGVDSILTEAVIARALPKIPSDLPVLIMPMLNVTRSLEHSAFPGTLALSTATLLAVLDDLAASLARSGIRRLVFMNGHGGNSALLDVAGRDLRARHGMAVAHCGWFGFADLSKYQTQDALAYDMHAGRIETSAMLAVAPSLVDMGQARDFVPASRDWPRQCPHLGLDGQPARPAWLIEDLHPDGAAGNAAAASAQEGEMMLDAAAQGFAAFLTGFARLAPASMRQ